MASAKIVGTFARLNVGTSGERQDVASGGIVRTFASLKVGTLKKDTQKQIPPATAGSGWDAAMGRAKSAPLQKLGQRRAELAGGVNTAA